MKKIDTMATIKLGLQKWLFINTPLRYLPACKFDYGGEEDFSFPTLFDSYKELLLIVHQFFTFIFLMA